MKKNKKRLTYKKSGVDIAKANSLISVLKDKRVRTGVLSGIGGFASLFAINNKRYKNPVEKFPIDIKVTIMAIAIPIIPNRLPFLEVSGDERPLKAKINKTPEIR